MDLGLNRVHVLVTGAAGGIGLEIVQEFLSKYDPYRPGDIEIIEQPSHRTGRLRHRTI